MLNNIRNAFNITLAWGIVAAVLLVTIGTAGLCSIVVILLALYRTLFNRDKPICR